MRKNGNVVLELLASFFAGNIMLLLAYMIIYAISKIEYEVAILNLVDFKNLLLQVAGSGLVGIIYTLIVKYFIANQGKLDIKSTETKSMFKEAFIKCLKLLGVVIIFLVIIIAILEYILSNSMTENLLECFVGTATIGIIMWAIGYVGVATKKELNKKLEERRVRKQNNI